MCTIWVLHDEQEFASGHRTPGNRTVPLSLCSRETQWKHREDSKEKSKPTDGGVGGRPLQSPLKSITMSRKTWAGFAGSCPSRP